MKNKTYSLNKFRILYQILILAGLSNHCAIAQSDQLFRIEKSLTLTHAVDGCNSSSFSINQDNSDRYNYLTFGSLDVAKTKSSNWAYSGLQSIGAIRADADPIDWFPGKDKYGLIHQFNDLRFGYLETNRDFCPGHDVCNDNVTSSEENWLMTLKRNGNVGIGTTSPSDRLHVKDGNILVAGDGTYSGIRLTNPNGGELRTIYKYENDNHKIGFADGGNNWLAYSNYNTNQWVVKGGNAGVLKLTNSSGNANDSWWMGFTHNSDNTSDANDRARIGVNIKSGGAGRLFFTTGSYNNQVERMRIDENGNVGIGTTNPESILHIKGDSYLLVERPNGIKMAVNGSGSSGWIGTTSNHGMWLGTNNDGKMWIGTNGNIGIDTDAPAEKLDVKGTIQATGFKLPTGAGANKVLTSDASGVATWQTPSSTSNSVPAPIYISGNNVGIGTGSPGFPLDLSKSLGDKISLWGSSGNHYGFGIQGSLLQMYTDGSGSDIAFGYGQSSAFTETMRIKGNGNVGIGTASPSYKLDVVGRSRVQSGNGSAGIWYTNSNNTADRAFIGMMNDDYVGFWGGGGTAWYLNMNVNNGNVGIGTSSPSAKLEVSGGSIKFAEATATVVNGICYNPNDNFTFSTPNNNSLKIPQNGMTVGLESTTGTGRATYLSGWDHVGFFTGGANRLMIDNDGQVGIGTHNPTAKLDVSGTIQATGFKLPTGAGANKVLTSDANGLATWQTPLSTSVPAPIYIANNFVGIGTNNPTGKLDVRGQSHFYPNGDNGVKISITNSISDAPDPGAGWIGTINNYGLYIGTTGTADNMYLDTTNNVFIGFTTLPTTTNVKSKYDLFVNAGVLSQDYALAPVSSWSDYVFEKSYNLKKLTDIEAYIQQNKHLPNIPSQAEIAKNGYSVHEMNTKFLEKIEELTLHVIEQNKEIEQLKKEVRNYQSLSEELKEIKNLLNKK